MGIVCVGRDEGENRDVFDQINFSNTFHSCFNVGLFVKVVQTIPGLSLIVQSRLFYLSIVLQIYASLMLFLPFFTDIKIISFSIFLYLTTPTLNPITENVGLFNKYKYF